jgi:hypothetical protein
MQAIRTKYFGQTNTCGSRIQASCELETIYLPYNNDLSLVENHRKACERLLRGMEWTADWGDFSNMVGGWHGDAMYWVFADCWNRTNISNKNEVAA